MDTIVTAAIIGVGGPVIVAVAGFWASVKNTSKTTALTLRAVELSEQGQLTVRYSNAIEQLGSKKLDVRLGGIYALERIAYDSPRDHPTVMEILAAFIRERRQPSTSKKARAEKRVVSTRPDVQAAVRVIGRRNTMHDRGAIDLSQASLAGAELAGVDLSCVVLEAADLTSVDMSNAKLRNANLAGADLTGARLIEVDLTSVDLTAAQLCGADLIDADFTGAQLMGSKLDGAWLGRAKFSGAQLNVTDFTDVDLRDADFTDARYLGHPVVPGPIFTGAQLDDAIVPPEARLPTGWARNSRSGRLERAVNPPIA